MQLRHLIEKCQKIKNVVKVGLYTNEKRTDTIGKLKLTRITDTLKLRNGLSLTKKIWQLRESYYNKFLKVYFIVPFLFFFFSSINPAFQFDNFVLFHSQ